MNPEEQNLITACLAHDRLAQKTLYDRYKRAMYTLAYRITGNFETANEVLQDGFLQVFRSLPNFRNESTLGAWIKTIMVHTAYKRLKTNILTEEIPPQYENENVDWGHTSDAEYLEKPLSLPLMRAKRATVRVNVFYKKTLINQLKRLYLLKNRLSII
jgi:RNA polymerase sigma factor (sigma-70 family)